MFRYYGWIALEYHTHDTDTILQDHAISRFKKYVEDSHFEDDTYIISRRNGIDSFIISRMHNHKHDDIICLYKWVAEKLPGSYGLLYIHDDEDFNGPYNRKYDYDDLEIDNSNKFIVWKLMRGVLTKEEDPFFSPCIPAIEDEYDPSRGD